MSTRTYINLSNEDIVINDDIIISGQSTDGITITQVDESMITEEIEAHLDALVEARAIGIVTIVAHGSDEERLVRAANPDLREVDREEFKKKWYDGKINPDPKDAPVQSLEFVESQPRDDSERGWKRVKEQANREAMKTQEGLNHDKDMQKLHEQNNSKPVVYAPKSWDKKDATSPTPQYDEGNLYTQMQKEQASLQQRAAEARALRSGNTRINPIVMNALKNNDN